MKTTARTLTALSFILSLAGCYTQVGSVRDDKFSGEYEGQEAVTEEYQAQEEEVTDSTLEETPDPYFDEYGYARDRFYLGYSYPVWVNIGGGWYDPWYYRPWYSDPFWCWNPGPAYYTPWWYSDSWYYPPFGWYAGGDHHGGRRGHGTTRTIGTTRGAGGARGTLGSSRGGNDAPGSIAPVKQDLPTAVRATSGTRPPGSNGVTPVQGKSGKRSTSGDQAVREKKSTGARSKEATQSAPRRSTRTSQPSTPPTYTPGSGSHSGGSRTTTPSTPAPQRPSGNDGTRGSGSSRGGGRR
jgi:hypothetical protein